VGIPARPPIIRPEPRYIVGKIFWSAIIFAVGGLRQFDDVLIINPRRQQMANERFLDMPSLRTIFTAAFVIAVFLIVAYVVYQHYGVEPKLYWLKVADAFINGAIVGIFFATLKAILDLPKWLQGK
jgi:hypothetical protein